MARDKRREFGRVRQLASGRWQARYQGPDGVLRPAPDTFSTMEAADTWLRETAARILLGDWVNPDGGLILLKDYASEWLADRPLAPRTRQIYESLFRLHIKPTFGRTMLANIDPRQVRRWHAGLFDGGPGAVTTAKAYRLLRAMLATAVDDGLIRQNPCRIKGAGQERSPERPVLTMGQVFKVADAIGERWRALVLLAAFAHLRWGELAALRRSRLDVDRRTVQVVASTSELAGRLATGPPKSRAGERTVVFPAVIVPALQVQLTNYAQLGPMGLVFVSEKGRQLRRANFSALWARAIETAGVGEVHFHDLRHSGNTWAAASGASLRELMQRMGHASSDAALRYQHATSDRDRAIADALDRQAEDDQGDDELS